MKSLFLDDFKEYLNNDFKIPKKKFATLYLEFWILLKMKKLLKIKVIFNNFPEK